MLGALIGGLISGAGSLISGLGASSAAKSQNRQQLEQDRLARQRALDVFKRWSTNTPTQLVSDANRAGFNPVTWLNAGALGHYDNMYGSLMGVYGNSTQMQRVPHAMEAVGSALSSAWGAFSTQYNFDRKMDLGWASLPAGISGVSGGAGGAAHPYADKLFALSGANGPIYQAGSVASARGVGGLASTAGGDWGKDPYAPFINTAPDKQNAPSKIFPWIDPDPYFPKADSVEQEYGDLGGSLYGIPKMAADFYKSVRGRSAVNDAKDMTQFFSTTRPSSLIGQLPFFHNPGPLPELGYPSP